MSDEPFSKALEVISRLNEHGVEYVVVGGVALNLHGILRSTEDLDVFVRPTAENVKALRQALHAVWDDPEIEQITAEDLCGDYPAVRYGPPDDSLPLDILTRLGEFASYEDLKVQDVDVDGVRVRVATPQTLHWMKAKTVRPQDHADAAALRNRFQIVEEG